MTKAQTVLLFIFLLGDCRSDAQVLTPGLRAYDQQRWSEAEVAFRAALRNVEASAPRSSAEAVTLYYLGSTLQRQDKPAEAEEFFRRALDIFEAQSGNDRGVAELHAQTLNDLAAMYASEAKRSTAPSAIQKNCEQAEPLFQRALGLREKALGPDHRDVGKSLENLMFLYVDCKRWTEAEAAARRAVSFAERQRGPANQVVYLLDGLAGIYLFQGRLAEAEVPMQRVLSSVEKAAGPTGVARKLDGYAGMLRSVGHEVEAKELEARAQAIRVKAAKRP